MKNPRNSSISGMIAGHDFALTAALSLAVIIATFFVSNAALDFKTKSAVFAAMTVIYVLVCAAFYFLQRESTGNSPSEDLGSAFNEEIEAKLLALEEANEYFGASLKFSDMFRLVASRIDEIVPFAACVLYLPSEGDNILAIKYAVGENSRAIMDFAADTNKSLAVKAYLTAKTQIDAGLLIEKRAFPAHLLEGFQTAAAVPLTNRGETFGVMVLYGAEEDAFAENAEVLLQAVGVRVAPLFSNSFAYEANIANALTDALTNLPNERGFFMILENQLAQSIRYREERPLAILAMDVSNFAEINQKYGHSAGNEMLAFAAETIKKQLRQMDVLTRSSGDEFLAILPTANEKISFEVSERIRRAFLQSPFRLSERENINLSINFGAATFWRDGETANQLLTTALLRKGQDKSADKSKVLWFPKEFVN